jgi:hypothetical protein
MIFTGNKDISFSSQPNKFSYGVTVSSFSPSGQIDFGFSGQSGVLMRYSLKSGKLFDNDGDFVYSWANPIAINATVENNRQSYFINNVPVKIQQNLTAIGQTDTFFVRPSGLNPEITFSINGETPSYQFVPVSFNQFEKNGTGYVLNTDSQKYFRLYSGLSSSSDFSYVSGFSGILNPGESGMFVYRKNFEPTDAEDFVNSTFNIPTLLYTNFGTLDTEISGRNMFPITQALTADFQTSISGSGLFNNFLNWQNLEGEQTYFSEFLPISVSLKRISGTGDFSGIYQLETGSQTFPYSYTPMIYDSGFSGYTGDYNTLGASGLAIGIRRLTSGGGLQVLQFDVTGVSQSVSITISGR